MILVVQVYYDTSNTTYEDMLCGTFYNETQVLFTVHTTEICFLREIDFH